ncbi:cytochrome B561 [Marichromatium purpuratum 984]|uniref:Cytochrome B561 n=1 Tax=Marichromatium purpuratum 984 TaxID=765910 RepID=W0E0X0_MARPU|nr:cytochrome b [Marichromatium purpuratum]AHF02869.1 cytochrome B561 [Marichromatium purpuratum 984]
MTPSSDFKRYGLVAQAFHWAIAILLLGLFLSNAMREITPRESELRMLWLNLHMSLGFLVFGLTLARIAWRRLVPPPALLDAPAWSRLAANLGHLLLNLATLLVPISGYLRIASKDIPADFFGTQIPSILGEMPGLHAFVKAWPHGEPMELFFYALIGVHVLAALWHQYIRRDNGLHRMLPW